MKRSALVSLLCCSLAACGDEPPDQGWTPEETEGEADDDDAPADDDDSAAGSSSDDDSDSDDSDSSQDTDTSDSDDSDSDDSDSEGESTGTDTDDEPEVEVPEFGEEVVIGTAADGLSLPRDLAFSPTNPDQLWTSNTTFHGMVIFFDPGEANQRAEEYTDPYGAHFMSYVSSFSFAPSNFFGSCQESRNDWNGGPQNPDDFMGPTLWQGDLDVFAQSHGGEGSHMDMLHQSPLCMGIANESANIYWVFDGLNGNIVRYDFMGDHGPGGSDHSDGTIRRYLNAQVTRVPEVPGHMVFDDSSGMLYVADTGTGRIMMLDTQSGSSTGPLSNNWDGVSDYSGMDGADWSVVVDGLGEPSGLEHAPDGRLFVTDHQSGEIIAFDMGGEELGRMSTGATSLMGIALGPNGALWYADGFGNQVVKIEPSAVGPR